MERIKRFALGALLIVAVSVAAACGRNENGAAGNRTSAGSAGSGKISGTVETTEEYGTGSESLKRESGETGGILRDMVDDMINGAEDLTGGSSNRTGTGIGNEAGSGSGSETGSGSGSTAGSDTGGTGTAQ